MGKRIFDLVFSMLGLIVLSPVILVAAVGVKLSSSGPVFFRQERVGRHFKVFHICKFRTMRSDAVSDPPITVYGDPRVTRFGRFLRRTKLDEIPQLFNVFKGEMSFVGPRPEVQFYVDRFRADYEEILKVRPGITDEASIEFRHEGALLAAASDPQEFYVTNILPRKIELARHYVNNGHLLDDLSIIFRTLIHL
ncbi:MAG: sugar transferase [candidate division Zixibacteria bacterium]|nr:sugar transferase [candidate division Zixibacteria bacterium]